MHLYFLTETSSAFSNVPYAILVASGLALVLGFIIVTVFRFFSVEKSEKEEAILGILPGANCGGCGYSGCAGYAAAIASGTEPDLGKCSPGGAETMQALSEYLGQEAGAFVPKVAVVRCQGSFEKVKNSYEYEGTGNCFTADKLYGGPNACTYGCLGFGDCVRACEYDAINVDNGLAIVNADKCVACGQCVEACPRGLIEIEPKYKDLHIVRCMNPEAGKAVKESCDIGCIGCTLCVKKCPENCISMVDHRAVIDQERCTQCGICAEVCPTKAITAGLDVVSVKA